MQASAHLYATFLPVAAGLALTSALLAADGGIHVLRKRLPAVVIVWLLSSLIVLAVLLTTGSTVNTSRFVAQRDIGYWLGGALGIAVPFLVCIALAFAIQTRVVSRLLRFFALVVTGLWLFLAVPQFFAVGWVVGCVLLGYASCM
jgi:hypothetical protein